MKKALLLFLIPFYCFAQDDIYSIDYELVRVVNDFSFNANGRLLIDSKNDISEFRLSQYKNLLKDGNKIYNDQEKDTAIVVGSNRICYDDTVFYYDFKKDSIHSLLYNKYCESTVLIKDSINYPQWEIKDEYKKIAGYNTQKAIASIHDRIWTVYFTNELPVNGGPWRLIGLPGLILEATENTSTYEFTLLKIEKQSKFSEIKKPYYKKESTFEDFVNKAIKRQSDEMYFRLSQIGEIDKKDFPLYETLEFIEKRE